MKEGRLPSLLEVFLVLAAFLVVVFSFTALFELPIQLALFVGWFIVILLGLRLGFTYDSLQNSMIKGISNGLEAVIILMAVGALIGTWIAGGIVPTIIYYGLDFIHPSIFLLATLIICALTSLSTGTSWGTVGTAGIAMMGIGEGLGLPLPLVAGAVLSGAYFGDKLSPLSDSTVLAASMSKVNVISHVKSMLYLDVPAFIITSILFTAAGFYYGTGDVDLDRVQSIMTSLNETFTINPVMFVPALIVIGLLILKKPSIPTISFGALVGVIWAVVFQGADVVSSIDAAYNGFQIESGSEFIDELLNRGGIGGMLGSIAVIILGLGIGGMLEKVGVLTVIMNTFVDKIRSAGSLSVSTVFAGLFTNIFGCAMYVSLILTPKLMEKSYDRLRIDRRVLSRNTEVGGTMTSGMVPWSDNGIFMAGILGVSTLSYLPFMWMSFVSIALVILYGYTGTFIWYTNQEEAEEDLSDSVH
ncbi:Na+/H+ antiporter NhaC [Halobacillus sp. ACCC02827]|uniref:Na+/H+ antiporter NhaC n=1 Tax=Bacillaceae TaxID=186817 RepID=UPI0002A4DDAB|nr:MULTISPECIES: Na+/H+ antiporter NhaC [Bacillaceae]ELK47745.1 Na+/H+ antiporter NhaC [Halobacillus sp. BAB-2008]QHT45428.1 Na+/H+ antiporter NhaC [Bacillus sp. SB49]WJE16223.1 Na+/H+ antiporter NhaC [Halobacillus sp. ACCC02827]